MLSLSQRKANPYIILDNHQRYVLPSINAFHIIYTMTSWLFIDLQKEGYVNFISRIFTYYIYQRSPQSSTPAEYIRTPPEVRININL